MVTGGSCGARPPSCSVVRVAPARRCGFVGAGPAAVARIAPPFPLRGGRRAAPVAPLLWWVRGGGGVGGAPPCPPSGLCGGGGGLGGALWPPGDASRRPGGRGGGGMAVLPPRASHRPGGRALHPPPLSRAGWSRRPSPGPSPPRPLPRGAGRPGVAVGVSGQWLAGCGAAGSSPCLLPPHSLPREAARHRTSCPSPPPYLPYPPSGPSLAPPLVWGLGLRRRRVVPAVAPVGEGATQSPGEPVLGVRVRDAEHRSPFQEGRPRRLPVGPRRPDH